MRIRDMKKAKNPEERLKEYLHSYLAWLYNQNHSFHETLTTEELSNYFISKIKHDEWFLAYLRKNPVGHISYIFEFIDAYKKDANLFHYSTKITPVLVGPYREVKIEYVH